MKKIKLLLTFDYELPLGGIRQSYHHSLFDPTERLLQLAQKLDVPLVFFADILSYKKFDEWGVADYTIPFKKQIQKAIQGGHDVQLHIHSHWLTSSYKNGNFVPSGDFELAGFAKQDYPGNIEGIIQEGVKGLNEIARETGPDYACVAFRAGGYNLNQETARILKALHSEGIRYDSSIAPGYFFTSGISRVDYRRVPRLPNWYLDLDGDISKPGDSPGILEIPIAAKPKGLFEIPTRFKLKKYAHRAVEDRGKMIHAAHKAATIDQIQQLFASRMLTVDNHTYSVDYMLAILDYNIQKFKDEAEIYLSLIGHPKSMGDYSLQLLEDFVNRCREKYGDQIDFCTFDDLYQKRIHENYGKNK